MIGIHIDSTATKSSIRRRAAIASNLQVSKTNKGEKGVVIVNKGNNSSVVENSYESPMKKKLTTTDINYSQGKLVNAKAIQ